MRNESDLNRYLTKEIKKIPHVMMIKASDKYTPGISDFLLWRGGKGAFLETKFIAKMPSSNSLLLKHSFSSKQVSFLRAMTNIAGCPAWGAVGVGEDRKIYCIPSWEIPFEGNWKSEEFMKLKSNPQDIPIPPKIKTFGFSDISAMIEQLFLEESKPFLTEPIVHVCYKKYP